MTQLCFELSVGFWLSALIAKEWSQRERNGNDRVTFFPSLVPLTVVYLPLMPLDVVT